MSKIKIYQASAGSGKTFTLSLELIKLLFAADDNYKHTLAVTFTNKATNEMKKRVLDELHALSVNKNETFLQKIQSETGLSGNEIAEKATVQLNRILHDYSSFSIETIDSFFQKILRSFAHEFGLYDSVRLELNSDGLLNESVSQLFQKVSNNDQLKKWLLDFIFYHIEEADDWNIKKSIRSLGNELFREELQLEGDELFKRLSDKNLLSSLLLDIKREVQDFDQFIHAFINKLKLLLEKHNLEPREFKGISRSPVVSLLKLDEFKKLTQLNGRFDNLENPESFYKKNSENQGKILAFHQEFLPLLDELKYTYHSKFETYATARQVIRNFYALGILSDLLATTREISGDQNFLLIQESNLLLMKLIGGSDVPFIYEKSGHRIRHIMIDEFQDTSKMQYLNFKPLLSNSLSEDHQVVLVGDVKQSIYRWRNGDWDILANQVHRDYRHQGTQVCNLEYNYRSNSRVIEFNNLFFESLAGLFRNALTVEKPDGAYDSQLIESFDFAYKKVGQKIPDNENQQRPNAWVEVNLIDGEKIADFQQQSLLLLKDQLLELQDRGLSLNQIAILCRKNRECRAIAAFLDDLKQEFAGSTYSFNYTSEEASLLSSSDLISFILAVLKLSFNPRDYLARAEVLVFLEHRNKLRVNPKELWGNIKNDTLFYTGFPDDFKAFLELIGSLPPGRQVRECIRFFNLQQYRDEWMYLDAFQNWVFSEQRHKNLSITELIQLWEEKKGKLSLDLTGSDNGIQLLTVHKSKGLQFDAVLIPFCSWPFKSNNSSTILWCKTQAKPFDKLPLLPVKDVDELSFGLFREDHYNENIRNLVDNLNTLYVAFTRARSILLVTSNAKGKKNTIEKFVAENLAQLAENHQEKLGSLGFAVTPDRLVYNNVSIGRKAANERGMQINQLINTEKPKEPLVRTSFTRDMLRNKGHVPSGYQEYGIFMHQLFAEVKTIDDLTPALGRRVLQGQITNNESKALQSEIRQKIQHLNIEDWFDGKYTVKTENELLSSFGKIKIPDRIMLGANETLVVDYKFGAQEDPAHKQQINHYKGIVKKLTGKPVKAFLFYYSLDKIVAVG